VRGLGILEKMQHQQGIDPPIVLSFKEVFEDPETNQFSVLEEDTSSSSAASSEEDSKDLKVPKFMMRCEEEKLQELYDVSALSVLWRWCVPRRELLERKLEGSSNVGHDCWDTELQTGSVERVHEGVAGVCVRNVRLLQACEAHRSFRLIIMDCMCVVSRVCTVRDIPL